MDYAKMKKAELITLCGERKLAVAGSKNSLVIRLTKADESVKTTSEPVKVSKAKKTVALSDEEFVRGAYQTILKRDADDGGLQHYLHLLDSGRDRSFITSDLKNSTEAKQA